jgi:molybdate transport repressor ModE-like protein
MTDRRNLLTPEALAMMDAIARTGSFAGAARELGKVPSALTYGVRQLEEALDVLLFDRRSGRAELTAAGTELLVEGRRLLREMEAVANRVRRVASGWEATLSISVDDIVAPAPVMDLVADFYALMPPGGEGSPTRLRLRTGVLAGTWESLVSGQADLALGVVGEPAGSPGIERLPLGEVTFVFCIAPGHALAPMGGSAAPISLDALMRHRAVAVADTAQRLPPLTRNLLPGQDVLTVPDQRAKLDALLRGLGCGYLPEPMARPHLAGGRLLRLATASGEPTETLHYAWRAERGTASLGHALAWWLKRLQGEATRRALIEGHGS